MQQVWSANGSFAGMNWQEKYQYVRDSLTAVHEASEAEAIAALVVEHIGKEKLSEIRQAVVTTAQKLQTESILKELLAHRPLQYVLNEAWFYGLKFEVNESVLIPRPETEELVDWVVKELRSGKNEVQNWKDEVLSVIRILDIGTGSGCIPIALKKNLPETDMSAIDVCSEAIHTATINAVNNETEINFQLLDFLDESKWNGLGKYDVIVSNPPYIKSTEATTMSRHVLDYEPHKALFVPDEDALLFYRKIADFASQHLLPNGAVYVEINQQLGNETVALFTQKGFMVELRKDMSGNERMVKASRQQVRS
jgi:release factor glutamine methyltransferase